MKAPAMRKPITIEDLITVLQKMPAGTKPISVDVEPITDELHADGKMVGHYEWTIHIEWPRGVVLIGPSIT